MPEFCPSCGSPVHREPGEAMHYCTNASCPSQLREHLYHFVSRGAMDIDGLGSKLIDRFIDLGWIRGMADIYCARLGGGRGARGARREKRRKTCSRRSRRASRDRSRG